MAQRLIIRQTCPLCGNNVEHIPDHVLKKNPHQDNVEFVQTRAGVKQYYHTNCWDEMIRAQHKEKMGAV